jgi:hypothetical protein
MPPQHRCPVDGDVAIHRQPQAGAAIQAGHFHRAGHGLQPGQALVEIRVQNTCEAIVMA